MTGIMLKLWTRSKKALPSNTHAQTLNHEAEHVVEDLRQRLAQQNLDLETYYKMRNTDATKFFEEEAKPVARNDLSAP